jgi:predicted lactoylglutathione lyase
MKNLNVIEIKAFVPAKDFDKSKIFYKEIGFKMASVCGGVTYLYFEDASILLQADILFIHMV